MKDSNIITGLVLVILSIFWIISNFKVVDKTTYEAEENAIKSSYKLCNGMTFYGSNQGAISANKYLKSQGRCR